VTAPILRVPDEGTLGAEKHLEAHLDKLLEGGGVKVTPLVGFRLLSHPLSHRGTWESSKHLLASIQSIRNGTASVYEFECAL
jgi:hypothetical protein